MSRTVVRETIRVLESTGLVTEVLSGHTRHGLMPVTPEPAAVRLYADVAEAVQAGDPAGARPSVQAIIEEAVEAMLGPADGSSRR